MMLGSECGECRRAAEEALRRSQSSSSSVRRTHSLSTHTHTDTLTVRIHIEPFTEQLYYYCMYM